jgi:hypothetical protein
MLVQILAETPTALFSFPIPSRQVMGQYLKLGHDQFFTRPFPYFTFTWPRIVTDFFIIKPTRCTNFTNLFWRETTCFGQFACPSSGVYSLYTQQRHMSYRFVDSFRAGAYAPARNLYVCHIPQLYSVQWINSWWWTDELSETCRVSCQNKLVKLVHLVGVIIEKVINMLMERGLVYQTRAVVPLYVLGTMLLYLPWRKGEFSIVWRTVVLSKRTLFYAVRYTLRILCKVTLLCCYQDSVLSICKCCIKHTTICNLAHSHIVGCVRIVMKRTYCLCHVPPTGSPSVRLQISPWLPLDRFPWN